MSLFCVNGQRLKFDIVGLNDVVFRKIKMIILENGGIVEHNKNQSIKFTANKKFVTNAYPSYQLYNITFIEDCVKNGTIIDPSPYRIGTPMLYDDLLMSHFLNKCNHFNKAMDYAETENDDSINSNDSATNKQESLTMDSDESENRINRPSPHGQISSRPIKNGNSSNKNDESNESSFRTTEDKTDQSPEEHTKNSKSQKNRTTRYKRSRGKQITPAERKAIVKFLVDNNQIDQVDKGLRIWSILIANGICSNRSPNSLYRHFRRYILPSIESYKLTERQLLCFKRLFQST